MGVYGPRAPPPSRLYLSINSVGAKAVQCTAEYSTNLRSSAPLTACINMIWNSEQWDRFNKTNAQRRDDSDFHMLLLRSNFYCSMSHAWCSPSSYFSAGGFTDIVWGFHPKAIFTNKVKRQNQNQEFNQDDDVFSKHKLLSKAFCIVLAHLFVIEQAAFSTEI